MLQRLTHRPLGLSVGLLAAWAPRRVQSVPMDYVTRAQPPAHSSQVSTPLPPPRATYAVRVAAVNNPPASEGQGIYAWFDLGDVLIDTRSKPFRLMPGAADYLRALSARGYQLGLISNIPADWGEPGNYASKLRALKDFVARNWGDAAQPFDWSCFSSILLPLTEGDRKPAPTLFKMAVMEAQRQGRVSIYQGEDAAEIAAARRERMAAFQIQESPQGTQYVPVQRLPDFVKEQTGTTSRAPVRYNP